MCHLPLQKGSARSLKKSANVGLNSGGRGQSRVAIRYLIIGAPGSLSSILTILVKSSEYSSKATLEFKTL